MSLLKNWRRIYRITRRKALLLINTRTGLNLLRNCPRLPLARYSVINYVVKSHDGPTMVLLIIATSIKVL
jgi:hypothetical protein